MKEILGILYLHACRVKIEILAYMPVFGNALFIKITRCPVKEAGMFIYTYGILITQFLKLIGIYMEANLCDTVFA